MPSKKGASGRAPGQAVKTDIAAIKKRARELLKKAGTDVKTVRRDISSLKKSGLVSSRIDVRKYYPSKYMLRKIAQNKDVLSGEAVAVRAPKKVREKYTKKGIFEQRGGTLIVPREYKNQRTRISRGLVELSRPLKMGEEIRLILPFKATDMENVANQLLSDPTLNGMKKSDELFGFRLFGHNMATIGFPTVEEFAEYILTRYQHLFSGRNGREGVKHFEMFRFKSRNSQLSETAEESRIYSARPRKSKGSKKDFIVRKRLERDAARKRKEREKETKDEYQKRIAQQRIRQAQYRQKKFLGD